VIVLPCEEELSRREMIAKRMIEIAGRGERDPQKLSDATLASLGLK
jgi:hypothetical protein